MEKVERPSPKNGNEENGGLSMTPSGLSGPAALRQTSVSRARTGNRTM